MSNATAQLMQAMLSVLRQQGQPLRSAQLQERLQVSQPTASRALAALVQNGAVLKLGQGRNQHYGLPRTVAGVGAQIPVTGVNAAGRVQTLGTLYALHGGGYWVEGDGLRAMLNGGPYFDGLPWLMQDMRPQGFLGRSFARQYVGQTLSSDPRQWSDDDVLRAITQFGDDLPGNLIVGEAALQRYGQRTAKSLPVAAPSDYPGLAQAAMQGAAPGSSAGGEQPKFCCLDAQGRSWIVKFSPAEDNPVAARFRHLLRCEHLALETLRTAGQPVARTQLHEVQGRVFLAAERFDRTAPDVLGQAPGRIGMVSLESFNAEFVGTADQWAKTAQRLQARSVRKQSPHSACSSAGRSTPFRLLEGGQHAAQEGDLLAFQTHAVEHAPHARQQLLRILGIMKTAHGHRMLQVHHETFEVRMGCRLGLCILRRRRRTRRQAQLVGQQLHRGTEIER